MNFLLDLKHKYITLKQINYSAKLIVSFIELPQRLYMNQQLITVLSHLKFSGEITSFKSRTRL